MNLQDNIIRILREETEPKDKKSRLLSIIEEDGLFQVIRDTGLSVEEISTKTGELPREVFERYIKDYIVYDGYNMINGDIQLVFSVQFSRYKIVESFYLSGDNVTVEINEYDVSSNPSSGSIERLSNLSDEEIYRIVDDMSNWGEDS